MERFFNFTSRFFDAFVKSQEKRAKEAVKKGIYL